MKNESSPYLIQHAENPVDWYPWGEEAFDRARREDKPIFLSIGYSTCHWCHVMAHESFEDEEIAALLNRHFISVKVDKEERPDIDSIYMTVCQAFTGSGGWPTSIFMTAEQKPFFAGTYFPRISRGPMLGMRELLMIIAEKWDADRDALLRQAEQITRHISQRGEPGGKADIGLADTAAALYKESYDGKYGGFGGAPKFPSPHNLLFLTAYYERYRDADCLQMAEHTLTQLYRGGIFDHIGYGFCRYSTDERFLAPHFEKMLYDNALLIMAYVKCCDVTKKRLFLEVAEKTACYVLREMTSPEGGFYSAQDADSDGEEGKYYLLTPDEVTRLLGKEAGEAFCRRFDITRQGNFEGKSIPNLLGNDPSDSSFDQYLPRLRQYRRERCRLHLDDKILTSWNSLMIAAFCSLYRYGGDARRLEAAKKADEFIWRNLREGDTLFVSFRDGKRGVRGFLDDYAGYIFAQLALYAATLEPQYLERARQFCGKAVSAFKDCENGGFYLYGTDGEGLILRPKESYDGAMPSGNSLMAWNLVRLWLLTSDEQYRREAEQQLDFLSADASRHPIGYAMFLLALLEWHDPPPKLTIVPAEGCDVGALSFALPPDAVVTVQRESEAFPLKDGKTTFYLCRGHSCLPPVNDIRELPLP